MPKVKQVAPLETLALSSLGLYLCDLGELIIKKVQDISPLFESTDERPIQNFLVDEINYEECSEKRSPRRAQELVRSSMNVLRRVLEYNVPSVLFDRLRDIVFAQVPDMMARIEMRKPVLAPMYQTLLQFHVVVSLAESLIGPKLSRCNFDEMPSALQQMSFRNLHLLSGLRSLNLGSLSGGWRTDNMQVLILDGLQNMKHLRYLSLHYDCTDEILLTLIESCPHLVGLDVSLSKYIDNDSINLLTRLEKLKSVKLHQTSVTNDGYVKLLLKLTNLQDIGRYDEIGICLKTIVDTYKDVPEFGLRKFASRYVLTEHLNILSRYCPHMQYLSIFHNPFHCDLTALMGINEMSSLHLLSCDFFSHQIRDILMVKGCNITHLNLEHVDEIDMNALMYISQNCPDLEVLIIYNCILVESTSLYTNKPIIPPFMNLKDLTLVVHDCTRGHLEFILATCFQIRRIRFGSNVPTSDTWIDYILHVNPMQHLEQLNILKSEELTIATAYKLAETCPKLTILNELDNWTWVTPSDIYKFKAYIRNHNFDLDIETKLYT